jgi:O-antigen ligase
MENGFPRAWPDLAGGSGVPRSAARATLDLIPRGAIVGVALVLGAAGGALTVRHSTYALILCVVVAGIVALAVLGDRALPWAVVLVAVLPWYPLVGNEATPPLVKQKVLVAAVAAAVLVPWLWSLAYGGRGAHRSRGALLLGILYACFAVVIYETAGSLSAMIQSSVAGFLFLGVGFLCARRFADDAEAWLPAAFVGLLILLLLGLDAHRAAPQDRVGYFVGYPITYGALVAGLLPCALLFAYRRSRLLAAALAGASAALLIYSESRSAWVAVGVMVAVVAILLARRRSFRALAAVALSVVVVLGLALETGSLHKIVETKLSRVSSSQSYTHRLWSQSYAVGQIKKSPVFGAGAPGFAAKEAAAKSGIGALDNGYLSISVDMGLIGLAAVLVPILVALRALARCLRFRQAPPIEVALALGIVAMAVVAGFYDSFYWAQIDLLLGVMGGMLSVRIARITPSRALGAASSRR